ncbi:MAG: response regulator [Flavobacteriales bacterium]
MQYKIRVQVFEDNHHLRDSLSYLIDNDPELHCVGAHNDCSNLTSKFEKYQPDVVLMDIEMPGLNGIDAVKKIKEQYPDVQVLMQTVFQDDQYIFDAICAGASGYLLKSASSDAYLQAIKDVYKGGSPMSGTIARKVLERFQKITATTKDNDYQLTNKEKEVLGALVEGKSFKMIASALGISYETVRTHMKNIYSKLHVRSNTEAVIKAIKENLI